MIDYREFFNAATGQDPYPYQVRLAAGSPLVLNIPTGLGKTEATVLAWLYRRLQPSLKSPRRLVYCLPMRSLVEQTRDRIRACFDRLKSAGFDVPQIDTVMGGEVADDWLREPDAPYVIVGTQDMLLSRALNRGYGMSRFQWPMAFGALNNDAYWVIDEVQLQGIGAVTATQLQAFRARFGTMHPTELTLASATIDRSWFETGDFTLRGCSEIGLDEADMVNERVKKIMQASKTIHRSDVVEPKDVAALVEERHQPGRLTIVVLNRVRRAQDVYRSLQERKSKAELVLLHSRYRPPDRSAHAEAMLSPVAVDGPGRIVVATQVVEAGVDVSASRLITDLAPWSALVQRFGRCNRRGEEDTASCIWLDPGEPKKDWALPYRHDDLLEARQMLLDIDGQSAAPAALPSMAIPLRDGLVIRKPEMLDLFDTSMDLAGHDVDVSAYIRDGDDASVSLFWRDEPPSEKDVPHREELCSAPISMVRDTLKSLRAQGHTNDARAANGFSSDPDHAWSPLYESELRPGIIVWLRSDVGWYDEDLGFAKVQRYVPAVPRRAQAEPSESCPAIDADPISELGVAVTLTQHAQDTRDEAAMLVQALSLAGNVGRVVITAALWHDAGKAHKVFQESMHRANGSDAGDGTVWAKGVRPVRHSRPGFRHELPGALAYLQAHGSDADANIIAYLIAAHHGKMRVSAQQWPFESAKDPFQVLGNRDGDIVPEVELETGVRAPAITVSLSPFKVGSFDGVTAWVDRSLAVRDDDTIGIFRLAYLELLVRIADWRASAAEARCRK